MKKSFALRDLLHLSNNVGRSNAKKAHIERTEIFLEICSQDQRTEWSLNADKQIYF